VGSLCTLQTTTPHQLEEGVQYIAAIEQAINKLPDNIPILGAFKLVVLPVKLALQAESNRWKAASALQLHTEAQQELEHKLARTSELRQKMGRRIDNLDDLRSMVDVLQNHGDAFAEVHAIELLQPQYVTLLALGNGYCSSGRKVLRAARDWYAEDLNFLADYC
jgi:hypothetical protein